MQETHYRKKGMFKVQDYHIFEAIRKNKEMGGSMLGVHAGLKPVLIAEYNETFELIVVEITVANSVMRVITGYGPQENWDKCLKTPFYNALEEEIAAGELEGRSIIVALDANAKLGSNYIPGDPYPQSENGKILSGLIERHALCVVNGLEDKRKGIITREKKTVTDVKKECNRFCDCQQRFGKTYRTNTH